MGIPRRVSLNQDWYNCIILIRGDDEGGMPRTSQHVKDSSFNLHAYVKRSERRAFEAEARRHSRAIAERAADPSSDEYAVMREIGAELDCDDFADEWKA
jgi:hypothetical protein